MELTPDSSGYRTRSVILISDFRVPPCPSAKLRFRSFSISIGVLQLLSCPSFPISLVAHRCSPPHPQHPLPPLPPVLPPPPPPPLSPSPPAFFPSLPLCFHSPCLCGSAASVCDRLSAVEIALRLLAGFGGIRARHPARLCNHLNWVGKPHNNVHNLGSSFGA